MTTFMYMRNRRILRIILISHLILLFTLSVGFADDNISIERIKAAGYMGPGSKPVEVSPTNETEKWMYGEFDPSQIWLKANIFSPNGEVVQLKILHDVKIGDLSFSEKNGIDIDHIVKTARWKGEQLLVSEKLLFTKNKTNMTYEYKFSLDSLMSQLMSQNKWPYILVFKFIAKNGNKEVSAKKIIILTPDNKAEN